MWTVYHIARRLGIEKALGTTRDGKLALWQVVARVLDQGSRLSAVRLAMSHAACDVLGLDAFNEDALSENLDWLAGAQAAIEDRLFAQRTKTKPVGRFLYDVTSSYVEGTHNALAAFGSNRDGQKGKQQIVLGLLCDEDGHPVSLDSIDTMLVRWFPQRAAVGKLLFHHTQAITTEEKAHDYPSDSQCAGEHDRRDLVCGL